MRGLIASIYEDKRFGNCSNDGISKRFKEVLIVGKDIPEIFTDSPDCPVVIIVKSPGYVKAVPVESRPNMSGFMFGGCFIYSSDSRFPSPYPIPLHDRQEAWQ